jgi:hypothetical protein
MTEDVPAIPAGSVLLHIGPPKTATSQLQASLFIARPELALRGVRQAGRGRHPAAAIRAVLGRRSAFTGGAIPPIGRWNELANEIRTARESRIIVSSEFLADAQPGDIRRIVSDLEPRSVHVVATLRPLAQILPSQWQQYVCDGLEASFDDWLRAQLLRTQRLTPSFWRRHRHDRLVARWAEAVGAQRVTVIALTDGARDTVLRRVEPMLALQPGVLRPQPGLANRSLSWPEVEAVRALNARFRDSDLPAAELARVVHFGASRYLKHLPPPSGARPITLPDWARPLVADAAASIVDGLRETGVRVVGDIEALAALPASSQATGTGDRDRAPDGSAEAAGALAMGVLIATGGAQPGDSSDPRLETVPSSIIAGVVARRLARPVVARLPFRR